jgi:hypothetical protein
MDDASVSRRDFCRRTLLASAGAAGAAVLAGGRGAHGAPPAPGPGVGTAAAPAIPRGAIGSLSLSRLILGCNLITCYMHSRDLLYVPALSRHYNTEAKILETFAAAEAQGITAFMTHHDREVLRLLRTHRERQGGRMAWLIAPTAPLAYPDRYRDEVRRLADAGADGLYVFGVHADAAAAAGKVEWIARAVETLRATGRPAGVAGHALGVVTDCEAQKVPADFYVKTLHPLNYPSARLNHDSAWCEDPERTIETMRGVTKPWIAFKVMAAGAIPPQPAFQYAYANGADFILAGMFDFQLGEDAQIAREVLAGIQRERPWRA